MIKSAIALYKKSNISTARDRTRYPKLIEEFFNIKISSETLRKLSGEELMEMLMTKGL